MREMIEISGIDWETPLTGLEREEGRARLRELSYRKNSYYPLHGVHDAGVYKIVDGSMPVMELQVRDGRHWRTWMVDDPLHWFGMEEKVEDLPPGDALVAGLGMGLMLHHMSNRRPDIGRITVVERSPDVVKLIRPTLPEDSRVEIVVADFYEYIERITDPPASVLWDLAVGAGEDPQVVRDFLVAKVKIAAALPGVPLFMFGTIARGSVLMPELVRS